MKRIALLGGTSWPSTIEYYTELNQRIQNELGGHHSCPLILYNIDYHEIKSRYSNGWDEIPQLLTQVSRLLYATSGIFSCINNRSIS